MRQKAVGQITGACDVYHKVLRLPGNQAIENGGLLDAERGERGSETLLVNGQRSSRGLHILHLVEGLKEAHFDGGVLFGFARGTAVALAPGSQCVLLDKDAD